MDSVFPDSTDLREEEAKVGVEAWTALRGIFQITPNPGTILSLCWLQVISFGSRWHASWPLCHCCSDQVWAPGTAELQGQMCTLKNHDFSREHPLSLSEDLGLHLRTTSVPCGVLPSHWLHRDLVGFEGKIRRWRPEMRVGFRDGRLAVWLLPELPFLLIEVLR